MSLGDQVVVQAQAGNERTLTVRAVLDDGGQDILDEVYRSGAAV